MASRPPTSAARTRRRPWRSRPTARSWSRGSDGGDFALARYNADGSLDTSFGRWQADHRLPRRYDTASTSRSSPTAGSSSAGARCRAHGWWPRDFALARYNTDGSLDTSFGPAASRPPTSASVATRRCRRGDPGRRQDRGRRVDRARTGRSARGDFALARYNTERVARHHLRRRRQADHDCSFGGEDADDVGWGVAIQPDGKIVAAGVTSAGRRHRRLCARPLPGRIGILGHGTDELKPADDLGYRHRGSSADGQLRRLDGQHPDQPQLPVASLRLGGANCVDIARRPPPRTRWPRRTLVTRSGSAKPRQTPTARARSTRPPVPW